MLHIHTHVHIHIHNICFTCIYMLHIHTYIHIHIHNICFICIYMLHIHTYMHIISDLSYVGDHVRNCIIKRTRQCIHTHTHTDTCIHTHIHICTQISHMSETVCEMTALKELHLTGNAYIHAYIHTYIHATQIHAYTHIHTHMHSDFAHVRDRMRNDSIKRTPSYRQ